MLEADEEFLWEKLEQTLIHMLNDSAAIDFTKPTILQLLALLCASTSTECERSLDLLFGLLLQLLEGGNVTLSELHDVAVALYMKKRFLTDVLPPLIEYLINTRVDAKRLLTEVGSKDTIELICVLLSITEDSNAVGL